MSERRNFLGALSKYVEINRRTSEWYEKFASTLRSLAEAGYKAIEAYPVVLAVHTVTFGRGGWSEVPLANMELSEYMELVQRLQDEPDEVVRQELDQAILAYFRRDDYAALRTMVEAWSEHFEQQRQQTFADALWAHQQERYTLSIPALATQIEGIVRNLTQEYEEDRGWIRRFNEAFDFDYKPWEPPEPPDSEEIMAEFRSLSLRERYNKLAELKTHFTLLRLNELYDRGDFSDPEFTSKVKRHAILHGVFNNFGELESLRLFFILELLHKAIGDYKERTQKL